MQAWQDDNPQHKHGRHRYDLEEYGLTPARIDAAFANYRTRFKDIAGASRPRNPAPPSAGS